MKKQRFAFRITYWKARRQETADSCAKELRAMLPVMDTQGNCYATSATSGTMRVNSYATISEEHRGTVRSGALYT